MFSTFTTAFLSSVSTLTSLTSLVLFSAPQNAPITNWDFNLHYDYIVVGAGSAGSVIAARLSENPQIRVLLLEAGGSESVVSDIPQTTLMVQGTELDWKYETVPQTHACLGLVGCRSKWPRGKVLGGTSAINYMMYVRGNRHDFDSWAANGATDWSYRQVLPYFLKSEDNQDPEFAYNGFHGRGGPLTVQKSKSISPLAYAFMKAGKLFGYPSIDINGPSQLGFQIPQATIRRGARCSSAKAFLGPAKGRANLHVLTFAFVTRILFNQNKEAIGVQFDRFGSSNRVYASMEVILSAGSINSPQLLMLSGIGPREHLESFGIPVLSNLPVGNNLQDHIYPLGLNFLADSSLKPRRETWTYLQHRVHNLWNLAKYLTLGRGPVASIGALEGLCFVRTRNASTTLLDLPDIEIHFLSGCLSSDDGVTFKDRIGITEQIWRQIFQPFVRQECFTLLPVLLHPNSRGYIRLNSRNPYDKPIIDPRYLTHPDDIETIVEGMLIAFQLATSAPFVQKFNVKPSGRIVPGCESYPLYSRSYMRCMARVLTATIYHPVGTCKMGSKRDPTTVVDSKLRVKGVRRLRVADGSMMPTITSGNTNAPIIMIGEKTASLIQKDFLRQQPSQLSLIQHHM